MLAKWRKKWDNGKIIGNTFMDFWQAFDTINHDLLIAKLEGYVFSDTPVMYTITYL